MPVLSFFLSSAYCCQFCVKIAKICNANIFFQLPPCEVLSRTSIGGDAANIYICIIEKDHKSNFGTKTAANTTETIAMNLEC